MYGCWSLEEPHAWCELLTGLRQLALVGRPIGTPDHGLLARRLTALEHLRLRLDIFDGVQHLSRLTHLTLLHLYKVTRDTTYATVCVQGHVERPLEPPSFLSTMSLLRNLDLHWEVWIGEESEIIRCLVALPDLEHLHVRLVPWKRTSASQQLCEDARAHCSLEAAVEVLGRKNGDVEELHCSKKRNIGITVLKPLIKLWLLRELEVSGGYTINKMTWERIQDLRGVLASVYPCSRMVGQANWSTHAHEWLGMQRNSGVSWLQAWKFCQSLVASTHLLISRGWRREAGLVGRPRSIWGQPAKFLEDHRGLE